MANNTSKKTIEAEVKLKGVDKANQNIKDLTTAIKTMVKSINKISDSFATTLNNINSNAKTLGKTLNGITNRTQKFKDSLSNVEKSAKKTASSMNKSSAKVAEGMKQVRTAVKQNVDGIKQGYDGIAQKSKEVAETAEESSNKTSESFRRMAIRFRTYLDYRIINAVVSSLKNLGKAAVDLEASFANIQAITSASDTEMEKLRGTILKVGEASKYSVNEISDATVMLGQAGLSADEINNVLETTTQLAAGTGSSLQNTIDLMTSALAVWGLNSEEASHLSDVMVTGMNRSKATLETFRMAVQYAGATMASLNVSFDEFASVASAAANAGIKASVVGTGLRAVASELISPTTKMVNGLAKLGLTTEDVNIESKGLVNVLYTLKNAGLDASNAYSLFGRRAAQFILAAQGQLDVVDELQAAFKESGATLKAYGTQMDTISAQWTALGNTTKEMASDILDSISWMIKDILKLLNEVLITIKEIFHYAKLGIPFLGNKEINSQLAFIEVKKEFEEGKNAAVAFYNTIDSLSKRDYGENIKKAIMDVNLVIEQMNKNLGLSLKYIDSVEDLPKTYENLKNIARGAEEGKIRAINAANMQRAREIISAGGTRGQLTQLPVNERYYRSPEIKSGAEKLLESVISGNNTESELRVKVKDRINKLTQEGNKKLAENLEVAFSIYEEVIEKIGETEKSSLHSKEFEPSIVDIESFRKTASNELKDYANSVNEMSKEAIETTSKTLDLTKANIENIIKSSDQVLSGLNDYLGSESDEILKEKFSDETERSDIKTAARKAKETAVKGYVDLLTELNKLLEGAFKGGDTSEFIKESREKVAQQLTKLNNYNKSSANQLIDYYETQNKLDKASRKAQKDIDRERAREFNKRYQNLSLQMQADSYTQDISEARRKGVSMGLSDRDETGTLSSYYNLRSEDLSKLQSIKTAIANKKTLEEYKKDYGDVFEQVQKGTVNLEDADYKTDGLISKMLKLDKSVAEVEGRFGDLNKVDLSDLDNQMVKLQKELDEIQKSGGNWFKEGVIGFKMGVESMKNTVSAAKLGEMIATDLGNGVSDALYSVADGTKSMKEAFSDLARSVLEDISKMLMKMAVLKAMEGGLGLLPESMTGQSSGWNPATSAPVAKPAFASGGFIPKIKAAAGTLIQGGIQGRDSVPAMLMPGEYVLKKSAVDALGTNFLNDLNNNTAQTLMNTSANMFQSNSSPKEVEPAVTNVWIVSEPDEAQMGPNDVIATIGKDILTGGQTRKLIQQVVAGRK